MKLSKIPTIKLRLVGPSLKFEKEYKEMLDEWNQTGEELVPFVLRFDARDFKQYIKLLKGFKKGIGIGTFVPHSTFWLINENDRILGVSNLRHKLNDRLLAEGGHIGYGIRPSERKKGYATNILRLTLLKAKKIGIKKAMVTCDKDNTGSAKTIINNNGKLWKEHIFEGVLKQNYWITNE